MSTAIVQTPRSKFLAVPENVTQHRRLLDNAAFQKAMEVGLAEYTRAVIALAGGKDLDAAGTNQAMASCFAMLQGAQGLIEVIARLSEPYAVRPQTEGKITSLEGEK